MAKPLSINSLAKLPIPTLVEKLKAESQIIRDNAMPLRQRETGYDDQTHTWQPWTSRHPQNQSIELVAGVNNDRSIHTEIRNLRVPLWQSSTVLPGVYEAHRKEVRRLHSTSDESKPANENSLFYVERSGDTKRLELRCDEGLLADIQEDLIFDEAPANIQDLVDMAANFVDIASDYKLSELAPLRIELGTEENIGGSSQGEADLFIDDSVMTLSYRMPNGDSGYDEGSLSLKKLSRGKLAIEFLPSYRTTRRPRPIKVIYQGEGNYQIQTTPHRFSAKRLSLSGSSTQALDNYMAA